MGDAKSAIFLSYASQDTEAAQRICEGLRAAGIEVFFDLSELRGGMHGITRSESKSANASCFSRLSLGIRRRVRRDTSAWNGGSPTSEHI